MARNNLPQARTAADDLRLALKECRVALPTIALFAAFTNLLLLAPSIYIMQVYDRAVPAGHAETLWALAGITVGAIAFMGFFEGIRTFIMVRTGRWFEGRMTTTVVSASVRGVISGLPPSSQSLQDLSAIRAVMSGPAVTAFTDLLMTPVLLFVAWLLHPIFGVIGLIAITTSFLLMLINGYYSEKTTKIAQQINTNNILRTETAVRNADVFVALGMLPAFISQWVQRNAPALQAYESAATSHAILFGMTRFIRVLVQIAIMTAGAFLVIDGDLAAGSLMACSMILYRAMGPAEQAISSWRQVSGARAAYQRLAGVLSMVKTEGDAMPLPRPEGRLTCEAVTCLLPGRGLPVLEGISFKLEPGEIMGILGPSASGKSTLCRSIVGLIRPVRGFVRLDGADVSAWPSDDLGQYLGYLPQDVELFEGSVRANIARLNANAPSEFVVEAAKAAGAHELILRLPDGYDTEIGPAGSRLSGGQRQRIGLARAFYGRPPLLVLDEPNSSLDGEGIVALIKAIETAKEWGSSVIVVSHQPHIMKPADKLLVLRNGRIQAFGATAEVLRDLKMVGSEEITRTKPTPMVSIGEKLG